MVCRVCLLGGSVKKLLEEMVFLLEKSTFFTLGAVTVSAVLRVSVTVVHVICGYGHPNHHHHHHRQNGCRPQQPLYPRHNFNM